MRLRLQSLEDLVKSDQTRIEPVDAESLPDGGDASNEPNAMTSAHDTSGLQDQIDELPDDEAEDAVVSPVDFDDPMEAEISNNELDGDKEFDAVFSGEVETTRVDFNAVAEIVTDHIDEDEEPDAKVGDPDNEELEVEIGILNDDSGDAAGDSGRDDLKAIKGVGPSIEKTLNDLGVYRFHQIAEMSEYDIDRVAQQLKGFRSRIYREDWIGQARDLQYQKNNSRF